MPPSPSDMLIRVEGPLKDRPSTAGMDGAEAFCEPWIEMVKVTESPNAIGFRSTVAVTETSARAATAHNHANANSPLRRAVEC